MICFTGKEGVKMMILKFGGISYIKYVRNIYVGIFNGNIFISYSKIKNLVQNTSIGTLRVSKRP